MKNLLIMRHAKSSWKDSDMPDHERALNKRGKKDAPLMGKLLMERELIPERILCSTAARACLTAEAVASNSGYTGETIYLDSFYLAEPSIYLEALRLLADNLERVMIIGHNPGLEGLVQMFTGQVSALPTGAIAYLALPVHHWTELGHETQGELIEFWRPSDLREKGAETAVEKEEEKGKEKDKVLKGKKKVSGKEKSKKK